MHDQFCIKFPNHHFCICVMEIMWGIPFILEPNQTLTCIMSSHSTSLEPKSWLTINLTLGSKKKKEGKEISTQRENKRGRKGNSQSKRKQKRKERKFPIKEWEKEKKRNERKFPIKEWEKEKRKERKVPTKEGEKVKKKKKKVPGQRNQKKCAERSLDRTISEQYRIVTKWTKRRKGNHDLKWSSPFNCQPKSVR